MSTSSIVLDADRLLSVALPSIHKNRALDRTMVGRIQQVLDAAVRNHEVVASVNMAAQKALLFVSPQGSMKDSQLAARADRLPKIIEPIRKSDRRLRLNFHLLIPPGHLRPTSDNPDEKRYFRTLYEALVDRGIWLRFDHRWIDAPGDMSPNARNSFRAWLSYGADGPEIPSVGEQLTRETLLSIVVVGKGYYGEVYEGGILRKINELISHVDKRILEGKQLHQELVVLRRQGTPGVAKVSDALGGTSFPSVKMWDAPFALLLEAMEHRSNGKLKDSSSCVAAAAALTTLCSLRLEEYSSKTKLGAEQAVKILELLRKAGKVAECGLLIGGVYSVAARVLARRATTDAAAVVARRVANAPTMRQPISQSPTLRGYPGHARTIEQPFVSAPTLPGSTLGRALEATEKEIHRLSTLNLETEAGVRSSLEVEATLQERLRAANEYIFNSMKQARDQAGLQWDLNPELGRRTIRQVGEQVERIFGKLWSEVVAVE
jgi:hypothetical protein